ncbi:MAG TPA: hypothetical protein VHQ90_03875 [Thermoanaerobaculia bacterium]|nr:hypothetical protein [Thermoanaerobaculia bacterium]
MIRYFAYELVRPVARVAARACFLLLALVVLLSVPGYVLEHWIDPFLPRPVSAGLGLFLILSGAFLGLARRRARRAADGRRGPPQRRSTPLPPAWSPWDDEPWLAAHPGESSASGAVSSGSRSFSPPDLQVESQTISVTDPGGTTWSATARRWRAWGPVAHRLVERELPPVPAESKR